MHPFKNTSIGGSILCNMHYISKDYFVHSVAVAGITKNSTDSKQFIFVFTGERISTMIPHVCVGMIIKSTCAWSYACTDMSVIGAHQEYFLISVDKNGTYAYGFTSTFVFKLDIYTNKILLNLTTNDVWPSQHFIPRALDIADTWAVVAGYGYTTSNVLTYETLGCLIDLSQLINASCVSIASESTYLISSNIISYNELYELSVAIRNEKILIGLHRLSSVIVLYNLGSSLNVTRIHLLSFLSSSSVGRVVDWADDTTMAILVEDSYETSWSTTEIFFYNENSVTVTSPLFTFPNNQQVLGSRLSRSSFARFGITIGGNMGILTGHADVLIMPLASAGYASRWIDTIERSYVFVFEPKLCIGGTYKNRSSLGPCEVCSSYTRNPGTFLDINLQCIPCSNSSSNSSCSLASLVDIDLSTMPSYSQAVPYPETTETNDIEDLLIKNVFQIGTNSHCLLISPLFWTIIVGVLCLLFLTYMLLTHLFNCKSFLRYNEKAKLIFKHTDIIGEGEMWLGGLATFAIIVLIAFAYKFSASFIRRYPIEDLSQPATFACDESLVNAQFSTGLELLATPKSKDAQPIFDLLDKQILNLTVELINTGFTCTSVTAQENFIDSKYVTLYQSIVINQ
ncbi:hypothetical protein I4U23_000163 [Adineta vaga]|nr:hypothetical protein I4U23_000163 [Adineta vaga]